MPTAVNIDNFVRAETDHYLQLRSDNGFYGRIHHIREPVSVDKQPVVRVSRDFLLSYAVFDLSAPVTVTMPDAKGRFQSLRAINQDHYIVSDTYTEGTNTFTQDEVGTRYLYLGRWQNETAPPTVDLTRVRRGRTAIGQ